MTDSNYKEVLEALQDEDFKTALENLDSEEDMKLYAEIEALHDMTLAGEEKLNDTQIRVVSNYEDRLIQQLGRRVHGRQPITVTKLQTREWLRDIAAIAENNLNEGADNVRVASCRMIKTAVKEKRPIVFKKSQKELNAGETF